VLCTADSVSLVITPTNDYRVYGFSTFVFTLESPVFYGLDIQETTDTFMDVGADAVASPQGAVGTLDGSTLTISTPLVYYVPDGHATVVGTYTLVREPWSQHCS